MAINLTAKKVEQLRKRPGRYRDSLVRGLLLVVTGPNSAAWTLRYEQDGRERWLGLGGLKDLPLAAARERAREKRLLLLDGVDPLDARRAEKAARKAAALKAMTFKQCAEAYIHAHSGKWRSVRHGDQWTNSLRDYVYPLIGNLPVDAIDTPLVLKVLEQPVAAAADGRYPAGTLWSARRDSATRVRGRIEAIIGWATIRGHRTGDNPARWGKHLSEALPGAGGKGGVQHLAALPFADVPAFMAELRQQEGVAARALEFTILTAARSGEVLGATWSEIDLDQGVWTIPAARMKAQREHRVPLSPAAVNLLQAAYTEANNPFVFIGDGSALPPKSLRHVLRRLGKAVTAHGFRSSFRDWAAERTAYAREVCELALAHTIGDAVEAAYRRGDLFDKRRKLMQAWADFCSSPAKASGEVVSLAKRLGN
jgi:integrase